jgi:hypothetical protein
METGSSATSRAGLVISALPHEIGQIITDIGVPSSIVTELRERGITVKLV